MTETMTLPFGETSASPADDLIGLAELERRVPASRRTIGRLVDRGTFPQPIPWPGRKRMWRRSEVMEFLQAVGLVPTNQER
jgi:predicted DNA-binding transcriptional regulator AlpA